MERGFHSCTMAEVEISEMEKGYLKRQLNDQDKERGFHSSTMEEAEISETEKGGRRRQRNDQDTTENKKSLAKKIAEDIKLNEGEEAVWNRNSIYKVPGPLAAVNPEAFAPKMVSMGPYHHGKEHLMPMEVHKQRAARCFIIKSKKSTEDYIEALWKVQLDLMDSYSQLSHSWREKDHERQLFLTLMLIDGCFLLEMLNVYNNKFDGYKENDPIFSIKGTTSNPQIAIDLMMLENQVPFTAIETLLTVQNGETQRDEICKEKINNLIFNAILQKPHPEPDQRIRGLHMLDIVRKVLVVRDEYVVGEDSMTEGQKLSWRLMERHLSKEDTHHRRSKMNGATKSVSVMELRHAGVEFKVANDDWHSSIEFENGTLTIPINRTIESEVLVYNMVAFELLHPLKFPSTLCYYTFMDGLLHTVADVKHLRTVGIISGAESRDYVILKIFKKLLLVNIPMNKCRMLNQIQVDLNEFYRSRMTGWKGIFLELVALWKHIWTPNLKQTFIKHPWKFISVVAAAILMALTIAQTYYAARSYRDSSHKKN